MWETPLKKTNRLNTIIYSSETKLKVATKFKQGYQIQIRLSRIYKIQIQSKPITKLKIRRIKIQIHVHLLSSAYLCQVEDLILKIKHNTWHH